MEQQWVIKSGGDVVYGPAPWDRYALAHRLGLLGWSVSPGETPGIWQSPSADDFVLLDEPPDLPGPAVALLPCTVVCPPWNSRYQVCTGPTFSGPDDALMATYAVAARSLDELRAVRITETKEEAGRRILGRFPMWKQSNMNMRANALSDKRLRGGTLDAGEEAEAEALRQAAAWIASERTASDAVEAWINAPTRSAADLVTMAGVPGWPE